MYCCPILSFTREKRTLQKTQTYENGRKDGKMKNSKKKVYSLLLVLFVFLFCLLVLVCVCGRKYPITSTMLILDAFFTEGKRKERKMSVIPSEAPHFCGMVVS